MSTRTGPTPTTDRPLPAARAALSVLAAADRLAREAADRAGEIEAGGGLPADLVTRIRAGGLFRLALPRALGGLEVDSTTFYRVIEALSYGDASVGWTTMIGNSTCFFAYLDPTVAARLLGDGDVTSSGVFAPTGRAVAAGADRYTVDGRWTFNSGVRHAGWHVQGVLVGDGERPHVFPDGQVDWRFAYLPHAPAEGEVEIVDHWDVLGLRGTGSHDLVVRGVPVPEAQLVMPFATEAPHDGPLWRFSFYGLISIMVLGFPLGVARRALDEIVALAPERRRAGRGPQAPIAEDPLVQRRIGRLDGRLQAARALAEEVLGTTWAVAGRGDRLTEQDNLRLQLAVLEAMEVATEVVDAAFALAGSAAIRDGSPLQRCFRDLHTAGAHIAFSGAAWDGWARGRLGLS